MNSRFSLFLTFASLLFLFATTATGEEALTWKKDFEKSLKKAKKEKKLAQVFFHSKLCGTCRRLKRVTFKEKKLIDFCQKNFVNVKVDIDSQTKLAGEHNVKVPPVIVFLDGKGKEFTRLKGYLPPKTFLYRIKEISKGYRLYREGVVKINEDLHHPEGNYGVGMGLRAQKEYWKAKKYLERALKAGKKRKKGEDFLIKCHYQLAQTYYYLRRHPDLVEHGLKVIELDPKNKLGFTDEMYVTVAVGYFNQKRYKKAYHLSKKGLRLFPDSQYAGQAYHFYGVYAYYLKKIKEAKKIWQEGIKKYPQDPWSKRSKKYLEIVEKRSKKKKKGKRRNEE